MRGMCDKHTHLQATRYLYLDGDRYEFCADCAWAALKAGHALTCFDGRRVRLNENEEPVFEPTEKVIT